MGKWLDRWDRANEDELDLHNTWLSGDDWAARSAELKRLKQIRANLRRPLLAGLSVASLVGLRVVAVLDDWRLGLAAGVVVLVPFFLYWRRAGPKYQDEIDAIERGPR